MKTKSKFYTFITCCLLLVTFISCNKDDDPVPQPTPQLTEIEKLPPVTQTGANKVGCLLNGKAFLPSGTRPGGGNPNPYCGYYHDNFVLAFSIVRNENNTSMLGSETIALYTSDIILEEGSTYSLKGSTSNHSAGYTHYNSITNEDSYDTTNEFTGELYINKLDKTNNIISGTFWFDAVNEQGKKVEIREGRFDMKFEGWAGKE